MGSWGLRGGDGWGSGFCKTNRDAMIIRLLIRLIIRLIIRLLVEMGWPDIHWLARDLGWAGGSHCLSLDRKLSMPLEPKLAPCGWRCPHRRPALTGSFGNWLIGLYTCQSTGMFRPGKATSALTLTVAL